MSADPQHQPALTILLGWRNTTPCPIAIDIWRKQEWQMNCTDCLPHEWIGGLLLVICELEHDRAGTPNTWAHLALCAQQWMETDTGPRQQTGKILPTLLQQFYNVQMMIQHCIYQLSKYHSKESWFLFYLFIFFQSVSFVFLLSFTVKHFVKSDTERHFTN